MNIGEATEAIKGTVMSYLAVRDDGEPMIPTKMQRPIFLVGPPGIGKTAVVEQVAYDLGLGFVSYSMTHHTRQSALGLPIITREKFGDVEQPFSEYTMSEILAAVYRERERTGRKSGILFLDEVNCVSETLAPSMLQFLQYKTFGMHALPEGWVVVTAGNPPEYNRAARDFDPAMLDRLVKMEIEPDLGVWQEYALDRRVHPAVTSYLDARGDHFYLVRADAGGFKIVTSRGWEDLSRMLQAYEAQGMEVSWDLPGRYLQDDRISESFSSYYRLFNKHRDAYKIAEILKGEWGEDLLKRASEAPFDERIAVTGLLIDANLDKARTLSQRETALRYVKEDLGGLKFSLSRAKDPAEEIRAAASGAQGNGSGRKPSGRSQEWDQSVRAERARILNFLAAELSSGGDADAFKFVRGIFNSEVSSFSNQVKEASNSVDSTYRFVDSAFGEGCQESLILTTRFSADADFISLMARSSSSEYAAHSKGMLFEEREIRLMAQVDQLDL